MILASMREVLAMTGNAKSASFRAVTRLVSFGGAVACYGWEASCFSDSATCLRKASTAGTDGEARAPF